MGSNLTDTRWTFARMVAELPPESRYELHEGVLLDMSPSATGFHQAILGNLYTLFRAFIQAHNLGKVFMAPLDVVLAPNEVVQPDLLVLLGDPHMRITGVVHQLPSLVVEIISPNNERRDRVEKRDLYAAFGIPEYWIVDPAKQSIEVYTLTGFEYSQHAIAVDEGQVTSVLFRTLSVSVQAVFE